MNIYIQVFYRLEYSKRAWAIDCRIMANFPNSSRNIYAINGTDTDEVYFVFFFNKLLDNELVASRCCRKCFIEIFFEEANMYIRFLTCISIGRLH